MSKIYSILKQHLYNIPGVKTKRKLIVIESDDWGSVRMASKEVYNKFIERGIRVDQLPYNRYDALESEEDLAGLFDILCSVKDRNGNFAKITANTIVANPDFDKIKESGFTTYYFEPFTETYKKYPKHADTFKILQQGIKSNVYKPQFHGREHLHVNRWMKALKENIGLVRYAFDFSMFDLSIGYQRTENSFMEALDFDSISELDFLKNSIADGLQLFEQIFGFSSKTFIAPCYIWSDAYNEILYQYGVQAFQGAWYQFEPILQDQVKKLKKKYHYQGQFNSIGQQYFVRNVEFEPSEKTEKGYIDNALKSIEIAFQHQKPAIIQSHRLNFIGFIDERNAIKNRLLYKEFLKKIVKKWPDVEFCTTDELISILNSKNNN